MFRISHEQIDAEALTKKLADSQAGALVTFSGQVRDHNDGRAVLSLEYEADEALCVKEAQRILEEAQGRFGVLNCLCVHRVGHLGIGEAAVWVGVVSAHRGEAFDACRYIIDEVKHRLPIWKKEHYADGSADWVNCQHNKAEGSLSTPVQSQSGAKGGQL